MSLLPVAMQDHPTVAYAHHQTACRGACQQGDKPCPHPDDCEHPLAVFIGIRNAALFTLALVVVIAGVAALWP